MKPVLWRKALAWLHRWTALASGMLLAVLGLSGSFLVWHAEIDAALNPDWFRPRPACTTAAMPPEQADQGPVARVLALLEQHAPAHQAAIVVAPLQAQAAYQVWERRDAQGQRREHFIDPHCGQYLGWRDRGTVRWDAPHLVPTVYELHRYFWAGETGATVAGAAGLVMLSLGLGGLWLAWPRQAWRVAAWRRVLGVQWRAAPARRWYDVHRAVGVALTPLLVLLSVTGAAMVFNDTTRLWVAQVLPFDTQARASGQRGATPAVQAGPGLAPDAWVALAQAQFPQARWSRLSLPTAQTPVEVRLLQHGEPRADTGNTRVRLRPDGTLLKRYDPLNAPAGNVLINWLFPLHSGEAWGLAVRLLWTLFGFAPGLLLGSGLWLWWRRRRAIGLAARRAAQGPAATG